MISIAFIVALNRLFSHFYFLVFTANIKKAIDSFSLLYSATYNVYLLALVGVISYKIMWVFFFNKNARKSVEIKRLSRFSKCTFFVSKNRCFNCFLYLIASARISKIILKNTCGNKLICPFLILFGMFF